MTNELIKIVVRGVYNLAGLDSPYSAKSYGPNWTKQRKKCLERDSLECRVCDKHEKEMGREPAVHHITPRRKFKSSEWRQVNALSNLITLCHSCHGRYEGECQGSSPEEFVQRVSVRKD